MHIRFATVVFGALIAAFVVWAFVANFGPVKLLAAGGAVVGVIALTTDLRRNRRAHKAKSR